MLDRVQARLLHEVLIKWQYIEYGVDMKNYIVVLFFLCFSVNGLEVPIREISADKIQTYYLDGWIPIGIFKKTNEEKNKYEKSLIGKYIPFTEYSRFFGNEIASSLYKQLQLEQMNANNIAREYGVFIKIEPNVGCSFLRPPSNKSARFKDDCTGVEYDGNGKSFDSKVVSYLATPNFTVQNDKMIVDISNTTIPKYDFTPRRLIDRNFVRGMHRISNAFNWHRFDLVLEEIDIEPNVIEAPEFMSLVAHIMLNTGATEQLKIISKIIRYGFDLNKPIKQFNNEWFSATELGIASLHPLTLKFLGKNLVNSKPCLTIERMVLVKQLSKASDKFLDEQDFEVKLAPYMKLQGTEYCWQKN
jgi:hypothetical protein